MAQTNYLVETIQPIKYDLTLRPDIEKSVFSGEVTIQFALLKDTQMLTFHAVDLQVQKALLNEKTPEDITYNIQEESVTLTFPEIISAGEHKIKINFTGILTDKLRGWYKSKFELNGKLEYIATTQLEETEARRVFPCIDEPKAKAIFAITLIIPHELTAISNTVPEKEESFEKGYKKVTFFPTPKMSTYPLAFIVGKFEHIEEKAANGSLVRVFTTPGKKHQSMFALDVAMRALTAFEAYFEIPYPLPVLDLIAIPDFDAGAMENWGAVTFRETALLVDPEHSALGNKQIVALVIVHELAHMWFGNLVTMEWWTHLWLNEGFACFMEYFITDKLFPQWKIMDQFIIREHDSALRLDSLENTHPIEVPVEDVTTLKENFDQISYAKGASVIGMLANYLGEDIFQKGLHKYLTRHAYGNAATTHLWEALSDASGKDVASLMSTWTQKGGHPLLTVKKQGDTLHLQQKRFFANALSARKSTDTTFWNIPLHIQDETTSSFTLMEGEAFSLISKGAWQKINSHETSFVRVLYSKEMYNVLHEPIYKKILGTVDRLGIIRDAFDGAQAGYLSTEEAMRLLTSYEQETAYIVWATIMGGLAGVENLIAKDGALQKSFDRYIREILQHIVTQVGWEKREKDSSDDVFLRSMVLGSYGRHGDKATIKKAQELFTNYVTNGKSIDPDLRGFTYNLVARFGGEKEFEQLKKLYIKETLQQERNRIGYAITAFTDAKVLPQILDWVLSDAVRSQDASVLIFLLLENPKAQKLTWKFIKANWQLLRTRYEGEHGFSRFIEGIGGMTTKEMLADVKDFFAKNNVRELERTIEQVIEQIEGNIDWWERDGENIKTFLERR